ncbi:hypothetical protein B0H63DRAFT_487153 [Podospora didyma]|uniref:Uncharacterized protein n=1 Tax=Podospora didyma TaxID=330526 RepID=A0AAE0K6R6_9PEZI|nr:hypothetical protein B0H63DRAFT_487153 [Podospora didyma]
MVSESLILALCRRIAAAFRINSKYVAVAKTRGFRGVIWNVQDDRGRDARVSRAPRETHALYSHDSAKVRPTASVGK